MRRLLQLATVALLLAGFVAPVIEFFDQWDTEGLENDTEFGVFALVFALCLVLLVVRLVSVGSLKFSLSSFSLALTHSRRQRPAAAHRFVFVIPPCLSPPLRI